MCVYLSPHIAIIDDVNEASGNQTAVSRLQGQIKRISSLLTAELYILALRHFASGVRILRLDNKLEHWLYLVVGGQRLERAQRNTHARVVKLEARYPNGPPMRHHIVDRLS